LVSGRMAGQEKKDEGAAKPRKNKLSYGEKGKRAHAKKHTRESRFIAGKEKSTCTKGLGQVSKPPNMPQLTRTSAGKNPESQPARQRAIK